MKVPIKWYFDKKVVPMKKWIIFALALMLVLAFTGCDKHTSDAPTAPTSPAAPTQSTPTTVPTTTPTTTPTAPTQSTPTTVPTTTPTTTPTAPTQSTPTTIPTTTPTTIPTTTPTAPAGNGDQLHILDFFRVEGITEDGMILLVGHIGGDKIYAYLKSDMKVDRYDTVYVDYLKSELKPQTGKFTHLDGGEKEYSYVFESILSIRFPVSGEPTYG